MKEEKSLFSAMLTLEYKRKMEEIKAAKGLSGAAVLRGWIDRSHKQVVEIPGAKQ